MAVEVLEEVEEEDLAAGEEENSIKDRLHA